MRRLLLTWTVLEFIIASVVYPITEAVKSINQMRIGERTIELCYFARRNVKPCNCLRKGEM